MIKNFFDQPKVSKISSYVFFHQIYCFRVHISVCDQFWVYFYTSCEIGTEFHCLTYRFLIVSPLFVEKLSLFMELPLHFCWKSNDCIYLHLFLDIVFSINLCLSFVVQLLSLVWLWPRGLQYCQVPLSFAISLSLLKLMSIESVMPSNHLILCRHLLLPSIFPSIRVFSSELALHIRWPKYWSFSFGISPSKNIQDWYSLTLTGLISLLSKGLWRVFFNTFRKHQFFGAQPSLWYNSYICTWLLEKPYLRLYGPLSSKWCLCFLICCLGLS